VSGTTPLLLAAEVGSPELVNLLIKYGAASSVMTADNVGTLPIVVAAKRGQDKIVKILLELDRTQEHVDCSTNYAQTKMTPLIAAAGSVQPTNVKVVKLLLARSASVNKWDSDKSTPLSIAAASRDVGIVRQLLYAGADPNLCQLKRTDSKSPLDRAMSAMNAPTQLRKIMQLLIVFGSDTAKVPSDKPFYVEDPECPIVFALKCRMYKELLVAVRENAVDPLRKPFLSTDKRRQLQLQLPRAKFSGKEQ